MRPTRRLVLQGGAATFGLPLLPATAQADAPLTLWYAQEAKEWTEALPLGNGRLGAMVFGGVAEERLQLNEATLWGGGPRDYTNPSAREKLPRLRELIFSGQIAEAERLAGEMMGRPALLMPYQPFCDLRLSFDHRGGVSDYRRSLSLDEAVADVTYAVGRRAFQARVIRFVSRPGDCAAPYGRPARQSHADDWSGYASAGRGSRRYWAIMACCSQDEFSHGRTRGTAGWVPGMSRACAMPGMAWLSPKVARSNAPRQPACTSWRADAVTILFSGATSFRNYREYSTTDLVGPVLQMDNVRSKDADVLRAAHVRDYQTLFHRVRLDLGPDTRRDIPTNRRIKEAGYRGRPGAGRALFPVRALSPDRRVPPGGQPANLQGLWNDRMVPPLGQQVDHKHQLADELLAG